MQIIKDRRALHQIPELERDLPKTVAYLTSALEKLSCQLSFPIPGAVCAFFDFGASSAIAFRSDADAIPITEKTELSFASQHPGQMHACGHDGHMAILLELGRRLDQKKTLPRNVLLVFQPAEETTGGAKDICDTGIFRQYGVEAIFGLHLWPDLPEGVLASRRGEMLSHSCEVNVEITGRSAHIAKAKEGIDALAAAMEFYRTVTEIEQALPTSVFRLLKFGKLESGTVRNAIPGHARLEGSLRAFQDDVFYSLRDGILSAAKDVENRTGCTFSVSMNDGYPPVINPGTLYDKICKLVDFEELELPSMITEDFSWYQQNLPGIFFFLGIGDTPALHADTFNFDETILLKGADFFENLAEKYQ